jgi:hypothetical protein
LVFQPFTHHCLFLQVYGGSLIWFPTIRGRLQIGSQATGSFIWFSNHWGETSNRFPSRCGSFIWFSNHWGQTSNRFPSRWKLGFPTIYPSLLILASVWGKLHLVFQPLWGDFNSVPKPPEARFSNHLPITANFGKCMGVSFSHCIFQSMLNNQFCYEWGFKVYLNPHLPVNA